MSAFQKLMYSWSLLLKFHGRAESIHSRSPRALDEDHDPFQRLVLLYIAVPSNPHTPVIHNGSRDAGNGRRRDARMEGEGGMLGMEGKGGMVTRSPIFIPQ